MQMLTSEMVVVPPKRKDCLELHALVAKDIPEVLCTARPTCPGNFCIFFYWHGITDTVEKK